MENIEDISALRQEIDEIDKDMVSLFTRRMQVAARVAAYKKEKGMPVLDAARERALLLKVSDLAGQAFADSCSSLYTTILGLSRSYQQRLLGGESQVEKSIKEALSVTPPLFPERARIAVQGVEGAYSQMAAEKMFPYPDISYCNTFEDVFAAVEEGTCRYGILPIENSTAGSVTKVYDLMAKHNFHIVRSARLKIDHNLYAKPGTKISDIREILSHEQALSQSSEFLTSLPGVKATPVRNTAVAAKAVAESDDKSLAALASRSCGTLYGLVALKTAVQDMGNNYTRFICLSKDLEIYPGADKTSLMMSISHRPGSLYNILSRFYALGINMTKLESRPIPDRDFEFRFYFDLDASVYSPRLLALLGELETSAEDFRYLGSYSE